MKINLIFLKHKILHKLIKAIGEGFVIDSPIGIVNQFTQKYLLSE